MKILIAPDKFKGSLTALEVAQAIQRGIGHHATDTLIMPMADGGEGSLNVIAQYRKGEWVSLEVNDPLFRKITAQYYSSGAEAFIEMAAASGLDLLTYSERDCTLTSTFGTGELIHDAIQRGATKITIFIGGSATNDAGLGMCRALGFDFLNKKGQKLTGIGSDLGEVATIVAPKISLQGIKFTVVCDVSNPFYGPKGAAHIYGAQKGANPEQILALDAGLAQLAHTIFEKYHIDLQTVPGSGAAGGLGGGCVAFLNAQLKPGTQLIFEIADFENTLRYVDLIITGEGKIDQQTTHGKLINGMATLAQKHHIPIWAVCGLNQLSTEVAQAMGLSKVIPLVNENTPVHEAMTRAITLITERVREAFFL